MTAPVLGITSINTKLNQLENSVNALMTQSGQIPSTPSTFINNVKTAINQSAETKLTSDLSKIEADYLAGLSTKNIDVSSEGAILNNFTKIVAYSVSYVELNGKSIAKTLGLDLCSTFKLNTCVSLIMDIVKSLPQSMVTSSIEHFVAILFPAKKGLFGTIKKK